MFRQIATGIGAAALIGISAPAFADRGATATEIEKIIPVLKAAGYVSWEEIELDDDGPHFEVDDARKADGSKWDVKLSTTDFQIVREKKD
ncbi:PepSY domain-containing protein [Sphingosinicella microcystinivorans]|uniref:PepSY domain-containing protein n=1 Tax=Sphingosinicella microcystinivorans TaxID=335406 RepID=UPI0022F3BADA|nr:PepSY domain-containing protein [Sphingosinicella microcystinivorans]WBX83461.1 PepSY domain-containing protein [Sphingosinicella microcystinivorans]